MHFQSLRQGADIPVNHRLLWIIPAVVLFGLLIGSGHADIPVHSTPEQAGLLTSSVMDVQGIVSSEIASGVQIGSNDLASAPLANGGYLWEWWEGPDAEPAIGYTADSWVGSIYGTPIPPGEIRYTAGYNEETQAVSGNLAYQKTMSIATGNKIAGADNIAAGTLVTFTGGNGGRMTSDETVLLDGKGAQTVSADQALCPFSGEADQFFPPFCTIATSGSSADLSTGSLSTSAGARFIAASADVPVSETYHIGLTGVTGPGGSTEAGGTAGATMSVHSQDGVEQPVPRMLDTDPLGFVPVKAEDLTYSESSTVSGSIGSFAKTMQYQSGMRPGVE